MATFTNQATLSYKGMSVSSNVATGELISTLTATKTALTSSYTPGGELVYAVSLVNSGTSDIAALTVTDDLGAYGFGAQTLVPLSYTVGSIKYFVNGVLQPDPTVTAAEPLTVSGIEVPAGGTSMLVYAAAVNSFAPPEMGGSITNTVTVSGALTDTVTASETVTAAAESVLDIAKSVSPTTVSENGEVTYTFVITNGGGAEAGAGDNISLSDTFSPILTDIAVSVGGAPMEKSIDYTYDEASGLFVTVPGSITVPAAAFTQDETSGEWSCEPGSVTITVSGII